MFICSEKKKKYKEVKFSFSSLPASVVNYYTSHINSAALGGEQGREETNPKNPNQNPYRLLSVHLLQRGKRNIPAEITYFNISSHGCTYKNKRNSFAARTHYPNSDSGT